jgi:MOSC domain-containing protein YiiM
MEILHIYISPGHAFAGRHPGPAADEPMIEVPEIECVAGSGIRGDRYFDHKPDYKGQITFFAFETHEWLAESLGISGQEPSVYRRNVITRGVDLNSLIGREFEVQGVRFLGTEEAKPCYWMDRAVGDGTLGALAGRGGLRARILNDGVIHCSAVLQPAT